MVIKGFDEIVCTERMLLGQQMFGPLSNVKSLDNTFNLACSCNLGC